MAKDSLRSVGLRLSIEGGASFREDLGLTNSQIKLSQAELKKWSSEFNASGKSMDALKNKQKTLEEAISQQNKKTVQLNTVLAETARNYGENSKEANLMRTAIVESEKQEADFKRQLEAVNSAIDEQSDKTKNLANQMDSAKDKLKKLGDGMADAGKKLTVGLTMPVVAVGTAAYKASVDFESAFAGVQKTVNATTEEFGRFREEILEMSTTIPASASAIAEVAENAGQLGIKNEALMSFTRTMIDLGNSTNLSATEGAQSLAKFANITQMSQSQFSNLGSVIVDLGNNFATTEADIVAMGMRLAGAGSQIGLSVPEIMALSTALSSVGIEAEAGGSAFSKLLVNMQLAVETGKGLEDFADAAMMSTEEFSDAFKNNATDALLSFIEGLKKSEENGKSAIAVLDDMEIKEIRLRDSILRATGASDVFREAIAKGNEAWIENTALTEEAGKRYETTASQNEILKNKLVECGIKVGDILVPQISKLVDKVSEAADWFSELDPEVQENIVQFAAFSATLGPLLFIAGKTVSGIGGIVGGIGTMAKKMSLLKEGTGLFSTALSKMVPSAVSAGTAISATATSTGALAATTGGMAGLGTAFSTLATTLAPFAPVALASAAAIGAVVVIGKELSKEVIPEVDLFKDHVTASFNEVTQTTEYTTTTISEETQKQVQAYLDMSEVIQKETSDMYTGLTETTTENITGITTKVDEMANSIIDSSEKQKRETLTSFNEMFNETKVLTDEEQGTILNSVINGNQKRIYETNQLKDEILKIYEDISTSGNEITVDQQTKLNDLYEKMKVEAVKVMSENETEQNVILNRLNSSNTRITAEMVSNSVVEMNRLRDDSILAASETRDELVRKAEELKLLEGGKFTEKADMIIDEANRQYEEVVKSSDKMRTEGIDKLMEANSELSDDIDISTGEIVSYWDKMFGTWDRWQPEKKIAEVETKYTGKANLFVGASEQYRQVESKQQRAISIPNMNGHSMLSSINELAIMKSVQETGSIVNKTSNESETDLLSKLKPALIEAVREFSPTITLNDRVIGKVIDERIAKLI